MFLENHTPFSAFLFQQLHKQGQMMAVLSVRGTFQIYPGYPLFPAPEQDPFCDIDEYLGEPLNSVMMKSSDLIPFKPNADITLLGSTFSPSGKPEVSWLTGIKIEDRQYIARVNGRQYWHWMSDNSHVLGKQSEWQLGEVDPVTSVRLSPSATYGGQLPLPEEDEIRDVFHENPLGTGILDPQNAEQLEKVLVPPILHPDENLQANDEVITPMLWGPVPPFWLQRRKYAGTYDDDWLESVHPRLPGDFDYRFYQYAPPQLIWDGFLKGNESIHLANMHHEAKQIVFALPNIDLIASMSRITGEVFDMPLNLDGVHIDFTRNPAVVNLTWRNWVPYLPDVKSAGLSIVDKYPMIENASCLSRNLPLSGTGSW